MKHFSLFIATFLTAGALLAAANRPAGESGLVATSASPQAQLHDVPIHAVTLGAGFWRGRLDANHERSLPELYRLLEEHGVVDNFRRVSGRKNVARRGYLFTDSDLYKWMEAAALALQSRPDPELQKTLEAAIAEVAAAQGADGYLNTFHTAIDSIPRFSNFSDNHELYCLGHLLQAGIAWYRGSGQRSLLDIGIRYADYVISIFGPGKRQCYPGHPEIEMALMELYRTTGEKKYLDFVRYLYCDIDLDKLEEQFDRRHLVYTFSGLPFTSRTELRSHAVRAMYACCGATDYYLESGDTAFWGTLQTLWHDMSFYKLYVTGGVGSRYDGEAFGGIYELPNERAYTETCAAIGAMMWNWRMLQATGAAGYAELFERGLYNGFLSGVSLSGTEYFYRNPLTSFGENTRRPWYDCTCCPPNVQRTLAALPGYFYSTSAKGLWVHLYHAGRLTWRLEDGTPLEVEQATGYPWQGEVTLTVSPAKRRTFAVMLRIPEWATSAAVLINGEPYPGPVHPGRYLALERLWQRGDRVVLRMEMPVRYVTANPRLREDFGQAAVMRGPLVYCAESVDQPGINIFDLTLPASPEALQPVSAAGLGEITALRGQAGLYAPSLLDRPLYRDGAMARPETSAAVTLIPYYAWANRGKSQMQVWMPLAGR